MNRFESYPPTERDEQFRLLVDSVRDYAIFMLDPLGHIATWNVGAERIKGYSAEEILGQHVSRFYLAEDLEQNKPAMELAKAQAEGRYEEEGWRIKKDGTTFWANVVISAIRNNTGELIGFAKVTRDLTERKLAEDALRASQVELEQRVRDRTEELVRLNQEVKANEERYRLMINNVADHAIYTLDTEGCITTWNDGAMRIYGYEPAEVIGKHRCIFFTASEIAKSIPATDLIEAATRGHFAEEGWRVRKDGSEFWAHGSISPLRDVEGHLIGYVKVVRDLTERKQAELELQQSLRTLRLRDRAIQAVSHGIFITDPNQADNPIAYVSPGFEQLTGYSSSESIGRGFEFLYGPKTDQNAIQQVKKSILSGQTSVVETVTYRKDGSTFWNEQTISPVRDEDGNITHFIGVQADVTQRRNLEDQLRQSQKMEAVGRLAGGVAHDFNNLLTVMFGYCERLLSELPKPHPARVSIEAISEAADRAADLTRQLLTVSRKSVVNPQLLNLNSLIDDTEKMLRRVIGEDVSLTTALDPNIGVLRIDPGQIGQVLMNLVVNARDAMPNGGKLTIATRPIDLDEAYANTHVEVPAGRYVLLSVSDTGTGMTPEVRSRIFDPFFTTKPVGQGTGLGLSVVHGIVKQSHGHIGAYTELGVGTTFKIYLPAFESETAEPAIKEEMTPAPQGTETILLVEDEENVRIVTCCALEEQGYTVITATNGNDAMRVMNEHSGHVHLLLTDVVMPEKNGRQLADALKPRFPAMKILYVSGYTEDAVIRHGILHAEAEFLQKPYTSTALLRKVRMVLDSRK